MHYVCREMCRVLCLDVQITLLVNVLILLVDNDFGASILIMLPKWGFWISL